MFWIVGGEGIFHAFAELTGWAVVFWASSQLEHVTWDGFRFYDMIFPLFLFIAGVAMPFSLGKRVERGDDKRMLMLHVIRRGLLLVILGIIYNNGLFQIPWSEMRYPSVLGRIGMAYMFAGLIFLNSGIRGQVIWFVSLLLGYWAALMWIPVPGFGAGQLTVDGSLVAYVDQMLLPGKLYLGVHDPEGILSTIPAISTALLGTFAGYLLQHSRGGADKYRSVAVLGIAGVICLAVGHFWNLSLPINKNLWSSSFTIFAGGWSLLLLALFYGVIDVWGKQKWALFFVVIGVNSITVYMAGSVIDIAFTTNFFFGGLLQHVTEPVRMVLWWIGFIAIEWICLYYLYRKRIFLRI